MELVEIKESFKADKVDKLFAALYFVVGYLFINLLCQDSDWNADAWSGWGIFAVLYAAAVLGYLYMKRQKPARESWFWLGIMLLISVPLEFWSALDGFQLFALIVVAAYWTLSVSGRLLHNGETSNLIFFDWWNSMGMVPFSNIICQYRALLAKNPEKSDEKSGNQIFSILLGVVIAMPMLLIILPLLSTADAGFEELLGRFTVELRSEFWLFCIKMFLAIPVAAYLYGLAFGSITGRNADRIKKKNILHMAEECKKISGTTICTAIAVICVVYVIFIGLQGNYLFAAFSGKLPQGVTYAVYAREGFFELCKVCTWNLVILLGANLFTKRADGMSKMTKVITVLLSVLTFFILATAVSKMLLYIGAYGLTLKRVLTMVFMVWIAVVFIGIIYRQKKEFPLVRNCVMIGAVLFCTLCVFPVEMWIESYNTWMGVL